MGTFALETKIAGHRRDPILTAPMLALCGTIAMAMGSFYLLLSAVPAHAAVLDGELAAGSTTAALMATTIVGEVIAPRLIARLGRRLATAIALLVLALPALVAFSNDVTIVLASCAARGLGLGVLLVAACGLAASLAPASRRAEAMGIYGLASALPAILGVPLGPWALAAFGPIVTASIAAAMGLGALAGLAAFPGRVAPADGQHQPHALPALRVSAWPAGALAIGAIAVGATITFLPLAHREVAVTTIMLALLLQGIASAVARLATGRSIDRHGPKKAIIAGVVSTTAAMFCLALPGDAAVIAGMVGSGAAFGVLQSATLTQLLQRAAPTHADGVSAVWNAAYDAGLGLGGLGIGALAAAGGYAAAFAIAAIGLAAIACIIFLICETRRGSC
ncbi:MFS transporter [Sphingomonas asaccharolytica]|uniref:MFS transporter n=1 Tax=Sphingomonas asaccharolytica TaxID=40681 RepID=UPI0008331B49|nr:MFS transporter [Sphingomonas asaccharolytica]